MFDSLFRRKRFLIQPKFQLALGGAMMLLLCAYSVFLVFSIMYPMSTFLDLSPEGSINPDVKQRLLTVPVYIWLIVLAFGFLLAFQAVLLSHRIAGPAFRLRRAIGEIAAGKYQQNLALRRHDCLQDLATGLMQLGSLLHSRRESLLAELASLRTDLEAHRRALTRGGDVTLLGQEVTGLLRRIEAMGQIVQGLPDGTEAPVLAPLPAALPGKSPSPAG